MAFCRTLAVLALFATSAVAQTLPDPPPAPPPPPAAQPQGAEGGAQALRPAPMPDPLMSPDLQAQRVHAPSLVTLVQQSAWQDAVVAAARTQFKQMGQTCTTANFKPTGELTVYAPAQFAANGALNAGIWSERVNVTGCGAPILLNILTVMQAGSPPSRIPTMPGETRADPSTQKSALQYADAIAERAAPPNCKQAMFTDTKFDGYTGLPNTEIRDGRQNRAWREIWSFSACGTPFEIELTFTPNAQGTQLSATNPFKRP